MAIQFHCPNCHAQLKLKDQYAGRRGQCPQCQATIVVPAIATAASSSVTTKDAGRAEQPATIDFRCTGCNKRIRAPQKAAGRQVACPGCGVKLRVPGEAPTAKPPAMPVPVPIAAAAQAPTVVTFEDLSDALFGDAASAGPANFDADPATPPAATKRAARANRPAWLMYAIIGGAMAALVILGIACSFLLGSNTPAAAPRITVPPSQPPAASVLPPGDARPSETIQPVDAENGPAEPASPIDPAEPPAAPREAPRLEDAMPDAAPDENAPRDQDDPASAPVENEKSAAAPTSHDDTTDPRSDESKAEARAEEFVATVERSIALSEDIMAVSRKIIDVPSAQKHAATWASLTAEAMQLSDQQNALVGETLEGQHAQRFQTAKRRDAQQAKDAQAELTRLQKLPEVMAILKRALEKRVTALKISPAAP